MIAGLSWSTLLLTVIVNAAPHELFRRLEVKYVGCLPNHERKLEEGFADAVALAAVARNMDWSSTAFTHYLRNEDGVYADNLFNMVVANNDPTNAPYTFSVRCAIECTGAEADRLAITDSAPQDGDTTREMKICPLFFTSDATRYNLDSKVYQGNKRGSWCQPNQHFKDFETAGYTLLHEMTHLDALARAAGVPARTQDGFTSHGTDDVVGFGDDYVSAARAFLKDWVEDPASFPDNALKPWQNAENLAAAATENWFIMSCGFMEIDP